MLINPKEVAPSQDFLKQKTVRFVLECLRNGNKADLPPTPIVRKDKDGKLVAIDGHNLLAGRAYHDQLQEVHIAESATHGLLDNSEANAARNNDLREKYESSLAERDKARANGIDSFEALIAKHADLFEEDR